MEGQLFLPELIILELKPFQLTRPRVSLWERAIEEVTGGGHGSQEIEEPRSFMGSAVLMKPPKTAAGAGEERQAVRQVPRCSQ